MPRANAKQVDGWQLSMNEYEATMTDLSADPARQLPPQSRPFKLAASPFDIGRSRQVCAASLVADQSAMRSDFEVRATVSEQPLVAAPASPTPKHDHPELQANSPFKPQPSRIDRCRHKHHDREQRNSKTHSRSLLNEECPFTHVRL